MMLMGSADKLPEKPKDQVRFVEDMSESEAAAVSYHANHHPCPDHMINSYLLQRV